MAVLVDSAHDLESHDHRVNDTMRRTLPLYVLEVAVSSYYSVSHQAAPSVPHHQAPQEKSRGIILSVVRGICYGIGYLLAVYLAIILALVAYAIAARV